MRHHPPSLTVPSDDLHLLPQELAARSISTGDIVLRLDDAIAAVEHLLRQGRRVDTWEGWVQFADGGRTHSLRHEGSFVLPANPSDAAGRAIEEMRDAQKKWERSPEYPGASLFFCIVCTPQDGGRGGSR